MDYMLYPIADHTPGRRSRHHAGQTVEAPRRADGRGTTPGRRSRHHAGQTVEAPRRAGGRGTTPGRRSRHHAGQTVEAPRRADGRGAAPSRPPARGGPTIYDGSTSETNAAYYSRATPCGWPAAVYIRWLYKRHERRVL